MGSINQFLFNRFRKNETRLHELQFLFWECTRRCNLNCLHCGSDCSADSGFPDPSFDDFLHAILPLKKVYRPNSITVAITGGEPLMREDLPECGRKLRDQGFLWGIVTNGYTYTPGLHSRLISAGMGSIALSVDGMEPTHNWLRGNGQSFNRAIQALDIIASTKHLTYDIITCVNQKNIYELEAIKELLLAHHVKAWRFFTIWPIGRAARKDDFRLTPEQLKRLMDFISDCRSEGRIDVTFSCEAYVGGYEKKVRDNYFFCHAGINIASVLVDGSISACPNISRSFIQGNIYQDSFLDVWENRFQVMRNRGWTKTGICKTCGDYKNCLGGAMHLWDEKRDNIFTCVHERLKSAAPG